MFTSCWSWGHRWPGAISAAFKDPGHNLSLWLGSLNWLLARGGVSPVQGWCWFWPWDKPLFHILVYFLSTGCSFSFCFVGKGRVCVGDSPYFPWAQQYIQNYLHEGSSCSVLEGIFKEHCFPCWNHYIPLPPPSMPIVFKFPVLWNIKYQVVARTASFLFNIYYPFSP